MSIDKSINLRANRSKLPFAFRHKNKISITLLVIAGLYWSLFSDPHTNTLLQVLAVLVLAAIIFYLQVYLPVVMEVGEVQQNSEDPNKDPIETIESYFETEEYNVTKKQANVLHESSYQAGRALLDEANYQTGRAHFVIQPMIVVSDSEFNEKTNNPMEKITPKTDAPVSKELPSAPPKEEGVKSYSVAGVHKKYRQLFDDFHGFAINHGPKTEAQLIGKLAPYGLVYKIERSGSLVAFNLGFIRMPLKGFFEVK